MSPAKAKEKKKEDKPDKDGESFLKKLKKFFRVKKEHKALGHLVAKVKCPSCGNMIKSRPYRLKGRKCWSFIECSVCGKSGKYFYFM